MFKDFWRPKNGPEYGQKPEAGPSQEQEVGSAESMGNAGTEQEYGTERADYERERFSTAMKAGYAGLLATLEFAKGYGARLVDNGTKLDSKALLDTLKNTIKDTAVLQRMYETGSDAYGTIREQEGVADDFSFNRFRADFQKRIDAAGDEGEKSRLEGELQRIVDQRRKQVEEDQVVGSITRELLNKGVSSVLGRAGKKKQ